jgi:hypothetical protein
VPGEVLTLPYNDRDEVISFRVAPGGAQGKYGGEL